MKKLYFIPATMLLLCLVVATIARISYTNAATAIYDYEYNSSGEYSQLDNSIENAQIDPKLASLFSGIDLNINNAGECVDKAELIVRVKYHGQRDITKTAFYSEVEVEDVLKGDSSLVGSNLCIIESDMNIFTQTKFINACKGWIPLQDGQEYIMLLHRPIFDERRKLNELQKKEYFPITVSPLSCYLLGSQKQTKLIDSSENKYTINTLKGYDVYATTQQELDTYYQWRDEIFDELNIN